MICPHRDISYVRTTDSHFKIYFIQYLEITVRHIQSEKKRREKFHQNHVKCTNFSNNEVKFEYIKLSTIKIFKHIAILHKRMIEIVTF